MPTSRGSWPVITAVIVLWVTVATCTLLSLKGNQEHFVYALDDTYIHMAIAKNFVQTGTWASSGEAFSSDSSSPLWTGLLAASYLVTGVNEIAPFILNILFATLLVILCSRVLEQWQIFGTANLVFLLFLIYVTPLPALIFVGMEHTLHICLTISYCFLVSGTLSSGSNARTLQKIIYPLASAVAACRYEGLFLIVVTSVLFALRRRFWESFLLTSFGALPIAVYGLLSLYHGGDFLPNSISLKGQFPHSFAARPVLAFLQIGLSKLYAPHMLCLLAAALFLFVVQPLVENNEGNNAQTLIGVFVPGVFLHSLFGQLGWFWFYRYEAYLVCLGIMLIFISGYRWVSGEIASASLRQKGPGFVAVAVLIVVMGAPLVLRAGDALRRIPAATHNIYVQQYQMAQFLKRYYTGQSVAVNDLGAVSFFANVKCVDLWGVGSVEVARVRKAARIHGWYDSQVIFDLLERNNVHVAVAYEGVVSELGFITTRWQDVGQWRMLCKNFVCASDTVHFFSLNDSATASLSRNLIDFGHSLPSDVEQKGLYVEHSQSLME